MTSLFPGPVGLSTGWHPEHRGDVRAAIEHARRFSTGAIELSALHRRDLPVLDAHLRDFPRALDAFGSVSVHGPAKGVTPGGWVSMIADLAALLDLDDRIDGVVLHPDTVPWAATDVVDALAALGGKLIFENMDVRKDTFRTARELAAAFDLLPQAGFCLDVAHVLTIDASLREGFVLLDAFGDRLRQIHISGIDPDGTHRPLEADDLVTFADLLEKCPPVRCILESPLVCR